MKTKALFAEVFIFTLISCFSVYSQETDRIPLTYQSYIAGYGSARVYDTYLSPLEYKGNNIGLLYEQMKMTGLMNGNISTQHLFDIEVGRTYNPAGTATDYTGIMEYDYGLHYRFNPVNKLQLFAGIQADGLFGFIYNNRNGNNPITGKINLNLNLSGIAAYKFIIKKQTVKLRCQMNIAIAGCMYSPQFGQSYYEIGLGGDETLLHFASFHNQLMIKGLLSVELPFDRYALRLTYMNRFYETRINNLDTRMISNSFYIGLSRNFYIVSRKHNNNYLNVFQ